MGSSLRRELKGKSVPNKPYRGDPTHPRSLTMFAIRDENTLLSYERPHIEQDMPGFFFCEHQWNKGGHIRSRTAVLEDPE